MLPKEIPDFSQRETLGVKVQRLQDDVLGIAPVLEAVALNEVTIAVLAAIALFNDVFIPQLSRSFDVFRPAARTLHPLSSLLPPSLLHTQSSIIGQKPRGKLIMGTFKNYKGTKSTRPS